MIFPVRSVITRALELLAAGEQIRQQSANPHHKAGEIGQLRQLVGQSFVFDVQIPRTGAYRGKRGSGNSIQKNHAIGLVGPLPETILCHYARLEQQAFPFPG